MDSFLRHLECRDAGLSLSGEHLVAQPPSCCHPLRLSPRKGRPNSCLSQIARHITEILRTDTGGGSKPYRNLPERPQKDYVARKIPLPEGLDPDGTQLSNPFVMTEQRTPFDLRELGGLSTVLIDRAIGAGNPLPQIPAILREIFYFVPIALALQLQKSGQFLSAIDWFRVVYAYDLPVSQRKIYYGLVLEQNFTANPVQTHQRNVFWLAESLNPHVIAGVRNDSYTRFVVMSLVRCFLEFADAEFTRDANESLPRARSLYLQALDLLEIPEMQPPNIPGLSPNPVLTGLKLHAQTNLAKLRSGRNIAGLKRQIESGVQASQVSINPVLHPTPYRYSVLIEHAKQLVNISQQVEAAYLSAMEKRDNEAYNLFKANQDLGLSQATAQLQTLRVTEAADGVVLANRQQQRAAFQVDSYQGFLNAGMNEWEKQLLNDYQQANEVRIVMANLDGPITALQAITTASSGGFLGSGASAGYASASIIAGLVGLRSFEATVASGIEASTQEHSLRASIEQRTRDWNFQLGLAKQDVAISDQQMQLAKDHLNIADQERQIAVIQNANAQATVDFLARKFTNAELYEWMSGVLRQVYSYFLQQATAFMGVDTFWNLEMPKAANPFDYRTIADVIFTIEYTALSSLDYRQQVIQQLDRRISADRAYSIRNEFADEWYDLNNPGQTATPMTIRFTTSRDDFAPNVEGLSIGQIAVYFILKDGTSANTVQAQLKFTEQETKNPITGTATPNPDGIISTRLGNAPSWTPLIGRSPFGNWELALPNTEDVRNLFEGALSQTFCL